MPAVHRHTDTRACGATTIVSGQDTVYANSLLVSVNGDVNSHGSGALVAGSDNVFVEGKAVVNNTPDSAAPDDAEHTNTQTASGSSDVNVGD
ncbi:hypothetical protein CMI47_22745 [Candidatus Pacearchaeota archaeon]|nr:hypothetical protein [Candidatus Pacearchaeota archaeon]|tara:strand:- start:2573 stop:2848 length:276 start_codon:yes stop_codon:yes gene_type:complete